MIAAAGGCAAPKPRETQSVASAWQTHDKQPAPSGSKIEPNRAAELGADQGGVLATVNGQTISRREIVDMVMRSHGAAVLDQRIGLELATAAAAKRGISVSDADVDREYNRSLQRLANPLATWSSDTFDHTAAEQLLNAVLDQRNVSREEFNLVVRRNAYLRKMSEAEVVSTDDDLHREYDLLYGKRARIRHIQLATVAEVERMKERLAAGDSFEELARRYSANQASAEQGGLLSPIAAGDERAPAVLRQVAFSLPVGGVSDAIRIGEWYHLIKLEAILPAGDVAFSEVRDQLERIRRERLGEAGMFTLFEKLFREANIDIADPVLRAAFEARHPERRAGSDGAAHGR